MDCWRLFKPSLYLCVHWRCQAVPMSGHSHWFHNSGINKFIYLLFSPQMSLLHKLIYDLSPEGLKVSSCSPCPSHRILYPSSLPPSHQLCSHCQSRLKSIWCPSHRPCAGSALTLPCNNHRSCSSHLRRSHYSSGPLSHLVPYTSAGLVRHQCAAMMTGSNYCCESGGSG